MATKRKHVRVDELLRKWCVEMAMRWPVITETTYPNHQIGAYGGALGGSRTADADVIGRAKKIEDWVTGKVA